jgi:hypothetical protein
MTLVIGQGMFSFWVRHTQKVSKVPVLLSKIHKYTVKKTKNKTVNIQEDIPILPDGKPQKNISSQINT